MALTLSINFNCPRLAAPKLLSEGGSSHLKALKGRTIIAQGKRLRERRPGYVDRISLPVTAKLRDRARFSCGIICAFLCRTTSSRKIIAFKKTS
jgi:hypothetical protein